MYLQNVFNPVSCEILLINRAVRLCETSAKSMLQGCLRTESMYTKSRGDEVIAMISLWPKHDPDKVERSLECRTWNQCQESDADNEENC
jgi:hypothetical protein